MEESLKTKYWDITQKIIECSMNVHNSIGCGFQESIYHFGKTTNKEALQQ